MRFIQIFLNSLAFSALVAGCSPQANPTNSWADFWQPRLQRDVSAITQRLRATGLPLKQLGNVHYERRSLPLNLVSVRRVANQAPVCIFAGVHGNEGAGTEAALSLIEDLANDHSLYPQTNFSIQPLVNPWGWERGFRYNYAGQDIARHFALEDTQETALLKPWLVREHCKLVVDLHEDSQHTGFYMLTYAHPNLKFTPKLVEDASQELGLEAASTVPQGVYQIAAKDFATNPRPTLAQYAREQGVEQTYIIETPMHLSLEQRVQIHRKLLDKLITQVSQK